MTYPWVSSAWQGDQIPQQRSLKLQSHHNFIINSLRSAVTPGLLRSLKITIMFLSARHLSLWIDAPPSHSVVPGKATNHGSASSITVPNHTPTPGYLKLKWDHRVTGLSQKPVSLEEGSTSLVLQMGKLTLRKLSIFPRSLTSKWRHRV